MRVIKPGKPNNIHYEIIDAYNIGRCSCGRIVDYNSEPEYKHQNKSILGGKKSGDTRRK